MHRTSDKRTSDSGFTLVEALISTVIISVGVLGMATLMAAGSRMQLISRNTSAANNLAVFELERLRMLPLAAPQRQDGGSLAANTAGHFIVRARTTIRWTVADGPACGQVTWSGSSALIECSKVVTILAFETGDPAKTRSVVTGMLWR